MYSNKTPYSSTTTTPQTRVDMLIALYNRTCQTLDLLAEAVRDGGDVSIAKYQSRSIFLLEQIVDGIDRENCSFADELMRLSEYALSGVEEQDVSAIEASSKAFGSIKDGFAEVRDDAVLMESNGEIPPLQMAVEMEG